MLYTDTMFSYFRRFIKRRKMPMIIAIGDVHGKISRLTDSIQDLGVKGANFIQVGDFGLGFDSPIKESKKLHELDIMLQNNDCRMWVIRGNHDNPMFWDPSFSYETTNITFVPDNTLLEIGEKKCFFAGGAISIDRKNRMKGVSYWPKEAYVWNRPNETPTNIDVVFTHDVYHPCSPFSVDSPFTERRMNLDGELRSDLVESQEQMKQLYDFVSSINPEFSWYHGHYHESRFTANGGQKTYCLSELEFKEVI